MCVTLAYIRGCLVMEILQTCRSKKPLLGLVTISTQTHIFLVLFGGLVCRKRDQ